MDEQTLRTTLREELATIREDIRAIRTELVHLKKDIAGLKDNTADLGSDNIAIEDKLDDLIEAARAAGVKI